MREGLCYRRNPASQRTEKWKSHASGYSFFLLVSLKWASAAGCTLPTDPSDDARCILQICPFRSGSPCDLVALREFWKSEKPSIQETCSDMSLLHAYMVLRPRGKSKWGNISNARCSLFYGLQKVHAYHSCGKYRGLDDVYCLAVGDWRLEAARDQEPQVTSDLHTAFGHRPIYSRRSRHLHS